jgi:hypothetical protein
MFQRLEMSGSLRGAQFATKQSPNCCGDCFGTKTVPRNDNKGKMRLAILADIHANLPALEAVFADARQNRVEGFIVAGDHINGGPHPNETMGMLRSLRKCWMIRGNTDDYLSKLGNGTAPVGWRTSHQWAATRWSYQHFEKDHLNFVAALPGQGVVRWRDTAPIRVVHGTPASSGGDV